MEVIVKEFVDTSVYKPSDDPPDSRWCKEMKSFWKWVQKTAERHVYEEIVVRTKTEKEKIYEWDVIDDELVHQGPPDKKYKTIKHQWKEKQIKYGVYRIGNTDLTSRDVFIDYCFDKVVEKADPCHRLFTEEKLEEFKRLAVECYDSDQCDWNMYRDRFLNDRYKPCKLAVIKVIWDHVVELKMGVSFRKGG